MKANELRIGNLVMDENYNLVTITHEDFIGVNDDGGFPLRPIPLTEEWLVKLGFELYDYEDADDEFDGFIYMSYKKQKNKIIYYSLSTIPEGGYEFVICRKHDEDSFRLCSMKYVHQLQNIYFSIEFEELTSSL